MSKAAEELTKKGFYVIRTGSMQKENIKSDNPMIIDYAFSKFKSDFGDIFENLVKFSNFFKVYKL